MVKVGMSSKEPTMKTTTEDRSWYKSYCVKCPYFVNDKISDMLHCVRPVGDTCLAGGLLVAGCIMADEHNAKITKMYVDRDKREADNIVIKKLSEKRRCKMIKRR